MIPGTLKLLVNDPNLWSAFTEHISSEIDKNHKGLEQETDLLKLGRYQGRIEILRQLLKLRDAVNGQDQYKSVPR